MNEQEYQKLVSRHSKKSPVCKNICKAFFVGGFICAAGELLRNAYLRWGLNKDEVSAAVSISLIFIASLLTALNVFDRIAKFAGAGTLVPITGFANAIVSPAMEYKTEGYVTGVGCKMFTVAGPVIVYGLTSSVIAGLIYYFMQGGNL